VAAARQARLNAGPQEWTVRTGLQRRSENTGGRYTEPEVAVERGMRSGTKAGADQQLGQREVAQADAAYTDAWHETGRALLKAWFDWLRERGAAALMARQAETSQEQLRVVSRRVAAGEAPRLEQLMAQADHERMLAQLGQARLRETLQVQELQKRFPTLVLAAPASPAPWVLDEAPAVWVARILDDNHEIELAQAEADIARLQSERVALDARPDPLVGVRMARERGGQDNLVGVYVSVPLAGAARSADRTGAAALAEAAAQRAAAVRQRVESSAQRTVTQAFDSRAVSSQLASVERTLTRVAELHGRAYTLGESTLGEALQARRLAIEASLQAEAARWDALEAAARVLLDAHLIWAPPGHH
jgi:outer membrane protein, heavy metal efflux system